MAWKEAIAHQLLAAVSAKCCTKCGIYETSVSTISFRTQIRTWHLTNISVIVTGLRYRRSGIRFPTGAAEFPLLRKRPDRP